MEMAEVSAAAKRTRANGTYITPITIVPTDFDFII
jgi:hypothetical protein